jgi:tetratricopeptide (TPR) repeat protein
MASYGRTVAPGVASGAGRPWLFGPWPDLFIGCGLGYALLFAVLCWAGPRAPELVPYGLAPLVLMFSGMPHYGATVLRVYEQRAQRRRYAFFSVWLTGFFLAWFVLGLHVPLVGSAMLTLMLTWSPWHYSGQNYGIALVFLRRAGVPVAPGVKRALYASFFLSFALTLLAVHGEQPGSSYAPSDYGSSAYSFLSLGIPDAIRLPAFAICGAAYALCTLVSLSALVRAGSLRRVMPAALLVATQSLWFSVPVLARYYGVLQGALPLGREYAAYAFLWVAVGHTWQYLWITSYYARRENPGRSQQGYLVRCLLSGALLFAVPALLCAPGMLGRVPFDAGLLVLVNALVNLHHFVLDGAIWKLRDGPIARVLLRDEGDAPAAEPPRRSAAVPFLWAAGAACAAIWFAGAVENEFGVRRALDAHDPARAQRGLERLAWVGRDSAQARSLLATELIGRGELQQALHQAQHGLSLYPTPEGWHAVGDVYRLSGEASQAIGAYREALALRPSWPKAANNLAWLLATHPNPFVRQSGEAIRLAEEAARATSDPTALDTLAAAYAAAQLFPAAQRTAARALELARKAGDEDLANEIALRLALYRAGKPFLLGSDPAPRR